MERRELLTGNPAPASGAGDTGRGLVRGVQEPMIIGQGRRPLTGPADSIAQTKADLVSSRSYLATRNLPTNRLLTRPSRLSDQPSS